MRLLTELYLTQMIRWPKAGRQVLAQFDNNSLVVYQAYRPAIGHFAASQGYFGGEFSLNRMSWIKPNFLCWIVNIEDISEFVQQQRQNLNQGMTDLVIPILQSCATVLGAGYLIFWLLAWMWVNPPLQKLLPNFLELV